MDTKRASKGDRRATQDGDCPGGSGSCGVVTGNFIHDNNNRDVPGNGLGLVGAGLVVAGGRHDTIEHNLFAGSGAWGIALVPYLTGVVNGPADCTSGGAVWDNPFVDLLAGGPACFFNDYGSNVHGNVFRGNGSFGNPPNADPAAPSPFPPAPTPPPPPRPPTPRPPPLPPP